MLSAHYRSPLNFSAELMESAKASRERILTCMEHLKDVLGKAEDRAFNADEEAGEAAAAELVKKFEDAMEDDFNTADAISAVFELVKLANTTVKEDSAAAYVRGLMSTLDTLLNVLGIDPVRKEVSLDETVEALIKERQEARKAKNYARADEIRNQLSGMGIVLEDTREGVKWKKV